jgi:hypothetical protein
MAQGVRANDEGAASDPPQATHAPASTPAPAANLQGNFFKRFYNAYAQEMHENGTDEPETARRIPPSPLNSPPFPWSDWPYGGAPVIALEHRCGSRTLLE